MKRLLFLSMSLAAVAVSPAAVLLDVGFEAGEGYGTGLISGQNGWVNLGTGTEATGLVSIIQAFSGSRSLMTEASPISSDGWWWKPINQDMNASSNKVVRVTWNEFVQSPAGPPDFSNSSAFGVFSYDETGALIQGVAVDNFDSTAYYIDPDGFLSALTGTVTRDQWNSFCYTVNYADDVTMYAVNGVPCPETSLRDPGSSMIFGDADIYLFFATSDRAFFDNLKVETFPVGAIEGTVQLQDFIGDLGTRPITVEIRDVGSSTILDSQSAVLDANGRFVVSTAQRGMKDIAIKGRTHLRKLVGTYNITGNGVFGLSASLFNGDIDGNNAVDLLDYDKFSLYYDKISSDSDWDTEDGDGVSPSEADLDGDMGVTLIDYDIFSAQFDTVGDN